MSNIKAKLNYICILQAIKVVSCHKPIRALEATVSPTFWMELLLRLLVEKLILLRVVESREATLAVQRERLILWVSPEQSLVHYSKCPMSFEKAAVPTTESARCHRQS